MDPTDFARLVYEPLSDSTNAIRLLTLMPLDSGSIIQAELFESSFPSQHRYSALSYEWGSASETLTIIVNGMAFQIRENLHTFLTQLCSEMTVGETLTVWTDAICIDQTTIQEKNDQVRLMGNIYTQAHDVIAWLGKETGIERLFAFMTKHCEEDITPAYRKELLAKGDQNALYTGQETFMEYQGYHGDLASFYNTTYFQRAWIIQELILAPSLTFRCGSSHLSHESLVILFRKIRFQSVMTALSKVDIIIGHYLASGKDYGLEKEADFKIGKLIERYAYTECCEPHDKVYAFVGVARNLRSNFSVDYSKSMHLLLMETMLFDFSSENSNLDQCFQLTNRMFSSQIPSIDSLKEQITWIKDFYDNCVSFLPLSLLESDFCLKANLVGRVLHIEESSAQIDPTVANTLTGRSHPVCRLVRQGVVLSGDFVFSTRCLCYVFRWHDHRLGFVTLGVGQAGSFPDSSAEACTHMFNIYATHDGFDDEACIETAPDASLVTVLQNWEKYRSSRTIETLKIPLHLSDFLIILKAEFPDFRCRREMRWT